MRGVKTGQKIAYSKLGCFLCKNLDNVISEPQRTVQNKNKKVHDLFKNMKIIEQKISEQCVSIFFH